MKAVNTGSRRIRVSVFGILGAGIPRTVSNAGNNPAAGELTGYSGNYHPGISAGAGCRFPFGLAESGLSGKAATVKNNERDNNLIEYQSNTYCSFSRTIEGYFGGGPGVFREQYFLKG
ncbi:MAG TPA: hypothetical protein PKL65_04685 [Bacteroidales bacterium]|nr:hypothetical protein [Bacteroidales bacterium]HNR41506.1 hypothetical protein [Bacteroidales bacterium]HPM17455.1 hypothetical protein [Bacteroidales bacterium]